VTFDGSRVWFASGERLNALDPANGIVERSLEVTAVAGTAFDGTHIFQIADKIIQKIDPRSGKVLKTIPAPAEGAAGMAWAEGSLWVGQHRNRKILQIDPETGAILRSIEAKRQVTGVTWVEGELWHGTWENEQSDIRRIDPKTGAVLEQLDMPSGMVVSGLEADGKDRFYAGGGPSGTVRAVKRPRR
jgi:glutamine cyclotransferase